MKTTLELEYLKNIRIEDYTYDLPDSRIARFPLPNREDSKLLCYADGQIAERRFFEVQNLLQSGQTLVFNNTKVIHARIFFRKPTGAAIEVFCLEPVAPVDYALNFASRGTCVWSCMVGNLKKWKEGAVSCTFAKDGKEYVLTAEKQEVTSGEALVRFVWDDALSFSEVLEACGRIPIPPYLNRESEASDEIRYQTVYSREEGSVAAATVAAPAQTKTSKAKANDGVMTRSFGQNLPSWRDIMQPHPDVAEGRYRRLVESLRDKSGDVIAVGTTSVRTLESLYWMGVKRLLRREDFAAVSQWEPYELPDACTLREAMDALLGWFDEAQCDYLKAATTVIILPGYRFRVIDALFTNFHQPQSTLLLLVAAAVGDDWQRIYDYALSHDFRFLSYGDSSLLRIPAQYKR